MRILLVEHNSSYFVKEVPEKGSSLICAAVSEEMKGERLSICVRDLVGALNESFIKRLRRLCLSGEFRAPSSRPFRKRFRFAPGKT
jgi:hypothetical protein